MTSVTASAYEVKHADSGALVRWPDQDVELVVDRSVDEVPGAREALTAATAAWSGKGGAPRIAVAAQETALAPGFDRKNTVFYRREGFTPAAGEALAVTVLTFDSESGQVLDADIVLNGKYRLGVVTEPAEEDEGSGQPKTKSAGGAEPTEGVTYDIRRVMAHEMGHALGLSDELGQKTSLMYPYVASDTVMLAKPATDDVDGLEILYTDAPAVTSGPEWKGGCNVSATGANLDVGDGALGAGLLVSVFVVARSRRKRGVAGVLLAAGLVAGSADASSRAEADADPSTDAIVTARNVSTVSLNGLFQTDVEVCGDGKSGGCVHVIYLGGQIGNIRQVVGGADVPVIGQRLRWRARPHG